MTGPAPALAAFYRPAEVAALLRCSEWWVREQARCRRIPYAWIGGSYLFTSEHIAEIVRCFEVQPVPGAESGDVVPIPARRLAVADPARPGPGLRARAPRRLREAGTTTASAA